ncbi:MAG: outer membrane beta-barrel protein [Sphingomonadales bacterium]
MNKKLDFGRICLLAFPLVILVPGASHAEEFKGPYVAVEGGIGVLKTDGTTLGGPVDEAENSGLLSGVLGYRSPVGANGRLVLGAEGIFGFYTSGTNLHYGVYGIGGYRVGDKGLAYLRVGYGGLKDVQTGTGNSLDGPVFGGGYEFSIHEKANLRLDYRYLSYGDVNIPDNTLDFSGHEITAGLLFNF